MRSVTSRLASLPKRRAEFIEPMDCAPVSKLPDGPQWLFEIKLDGYRAVGVKSDRSVNLFSRRHKLFNHQYPHIVEALRELPEGTVVDGEVVALDESGRPNFNLLQNFRSEASHIQYFVFDLLICQDRDLTSLPLSARRKLMKSHLKLNSGRIRIAEQFEVPANDMLAASTAIGRRNREAQGQFVRTWKAIRLLGEMPGESRPGVGGRRVHPWTTRFRFAIVGYYQGKDLMYAARVRNRIRNCGDISRGCFWAQSPIVGLAELRRK